MPAVERIYKDVSVAECEGTRPNSGRPWKKISPIVTSMWEKHEGFERHRYDKDIDKRVGRRRSCEGSISML